MNLSSHSDDTTLCAKLNHHLPSRDVKRTGNRMPSFLAPDGNYPDPFPRFLVMMVVSLTRELSQEVV